MATSVWDNTERTEIIATFNDCDEGSDWIMPYGKTKRERHIVVWVNIKLFGARVFSLSYKHWETSQCLCSDNDVDARGAAKDGFPFLLGDASSNRDNRLSIWRTLRGEQGQSIEKFIFGSFSYAACVNDDEIRVFDFVR
jgi:hypothetical protein